MSQDFTVRKIAATLRLSTEQALAYGLITEDEARANGWTPPPPVPRLRHWRWAIRSWWGEHKPTVHLGPCNHEDCL